MLLEIVVVLLLTAVNGALAMSELAVVSSRPARLRALAAAGSRGAEAALRLAEEPGRFLSSVQIGITLVGVVSGAFSGATLGFRVADFLEARGFPDEGAEALGVGAVVVAITWLSVVFGELVPKRLALRDPERTAARVAPAMRRVAVVTAPVVWLLDRSSRVALRILGAAEETGGGVTEEEVRSLIAEAETAGVIETEERDMISGVMRLADRSARALMTPRREVELIDAAAPPEEALRRLRAATHSRLPLRDGDADAVVGVVSVREALAACDSGAPLDLRALARTAPVVMDVAEAITVIAKLKDSTAHMALVFDEYGHFEGVVTAMDVLEAITGAFRETEGEEEIVVTREDGSLLVPGWTPADEFFDRIGVPLPDGEFETMAGFALDRMGRMPEVGERFDFAGWRFEIVDLDRRRIDKLLVERVEAAG